MAILPTAHKLRRRRTLVLRQDLLDFLKELPKVPARGVEGHHKASDAETTDTHAG
jgi:hypothetical protein